MKKVLLFPLLLLFSVSCFGAETPPMSDTVSVTTVLGSNMVIQRDKPFTVWGWGPAGKTVTVTASWAREPLTGTVRSTGEWEIAIPAAAANAHPQRLEIREEDRPPIVFTNILIGDVWVCSGQSNMTFPVDSLGPWPGSFGVDNFAGEVAAASYPELRLYTAPYQRADSPAEKLSGKVPWKVCTPDNIRNFSALSYFFGRKLHTSLQVPVGLVVSGLAATSGQEWTGAPELEKHPFYANAPDPKSHASALYNGMIHPLRRLSVKGFIWDQGEGNRNDPYMSYAHLQAEMVAGWRRIFDQGDLPFYYVQMTPYAASFFQTDPWGGNPRSNDYAYFRETQAAIRELVPHTGMAVTMDVDEIVNIHWKAKRPVGERLALLALHKIYGRETPCTGPQFSHVTIEGEKWIVHFKPGTADGLTTAGGAPLNQHFFLAGTDSTFVPAIASIRGNTIEVTPPAGFPAPALALRYAFTNFPVTNLQNGAGLPAEPFRTDDWLKIIRTSPGEQPVNAPLTAGAYRFFSDATRGDPKTAGVVDSSSLAGSQLEQRTYSAGTGQEWIVTPIGNGDYTIVNTHSGLALALPGETPSPGLPLVTAGPDPSSPSQRWKIQWLGDYLGHTIRSSADTAYFVCIRDNSGEDGARLVLGRHDTPANKSFHFQLTAYLDREATNWFRPTTGWIAGDGGASLKLSTGKILWSFGDSHYNDYKDGTVICLFNTRNLVRVQAKEHNFNPEPPNAATLKSPLGPFTYRSHPDVPGSFNWPSPFIEVNGYVYNLLANFRQGEGGTWSYNGPPALGKMDIRTLDPATITYHQIQNVDTIDFAGGFAKGDDSYVYVFGFRHAEDQPIYMQNMYVARFPADSIDQGIWHFWNGSDWNSTDATDAAVIHQGIAAHVCRIGDKYIRTGVRNTAFWYPCVPEEEARKVWVSTSDSPVGPWTPEKAVYTINESYHGAIPTFYGGWPSAANINSRNEMLIIYSINGYKQGCDIPETCNQNRMDPDVTYRPRAIRVPLKMFDP